ncbi:MAG: HAMP domain-containing histidine kinase [Pseudomonadales bacterium]|nr:HAMP domain-containing histidine kinase [Pseudomonadales bacterium]
MFNVYQQFQNEMFYQYRDSAEQVIVEINDKFDALLQEEEKRPFTDYQFYKVSESPLLKQKAIALSPLARLSSVSGKQSLPGLVGYFQIDHHDSFSSPLLPSVDESLLTSDTLNIERDELNQRLERQSEIKERLINAKLLSSKNAKREEQEASKAKSKTKSEPKPRTRAAAKKTAKSKSRTSFTSQLKNLALNESYAKKEIQSKRKTRASRQEKIITTPQESADIFLANAQEKAKTIENRQSPMGFSQLAGRMASQPSPVAISESSSSRSSLSDQEEDSVLTIPQTPQIPQTLQTLQTQEQKTSQNSPPLFTTITGEIDPIQMLRDDSGHYIFYRRVWRDKERYIQGFIVNERRLLQETIQPVFMRGNFDKGLKLIAGYDGNITHEYEFQHQYGKRSYANTPSFFDRPDDNILILRKTAIDPFDKLEILVTANTIPLGSGLTIINVLVFAILTITSIGLFILYRLGLNQIALAEQRLNFVSSVSHELKTPLTSILMYGEMLKEDMVKNEDKKKTYYDFIYYESERLSRLISNILQLSKLGANNNTLSPSYANSFSYTHIATLLDIAQSKVSTLTDRHQYHLYTHPIPDSEKNTKALVDIDGFSQIVINLVDNAIKFSSDGETKQVDIGFRQDPAHSDVICFFVRDFGPGIPKEESKKVFDLFYRIGSEMTRTTPGTGIGLALVTELARAMNGRVEFVNCSPGVEFQVYLPVAR